MIVTVKKRVAQAARFFFSAPQEPVLFRTNPVVNAAPWLIATMRVNFAEAHWLRFPVYITAARRPDNEKRLKHLFFIVE